MVIQNLYISRKLRMLSEFSFKLYQFSERSWPGALIRVRPPKPQPYVYEGRSDIEAAKDSVGCDEATYISRRRLIDRFYRSEVLMESDYVSFGLHVK